jgi:hypothetical protein
MEMQSRKNVRDGMFDELSGADSRDMYVDLRWQSCDNA